MKKLSPTQYKTITEALAGCKTIATRHAHFYSAIKDAEVVLIVRTQLNGAEVGQVTCEGRTLHIGRNAEDKFNAMAADEEAMYAVMRAKVRASTGFHPGIS